jgi:hypothetical protein
MEDGRAKGKTRCRNVITLSPSVRMALPDFAVGTMTARRRAAIGKAALDLSSLA